MGIADKLYINPRTDSDKLRWFFDSFLSTLAVRAVICLWHDGYDNDHKHDYGHSFRALLRTQNDNFRVTDLFGPSCDELTLAQGVNMAFERLALRPNIETCLCIWTKEENSLFLATNFDDTDKMELLLTWDQY